MTDQKIDNYTCSLSPELLERAHVELKEDVQTRKLEIQTLRERLLRYPGLKARVDNKFLLKFLRARKFDQEKTFELVLNYYKMKQENEDIYADMSVKSIQTLLESGISSVLEGRAKNGEAILIFRSGLWDPLTNPIVEIYKLSYLVLSRLIEYEDVQVTGVCFINDMTGMSWSHAKEFSPQWSKKMVAMIQDAFPMRLKAIHYLHQPSFFDYVFAMIKPFLKEKLASRLHFHGEKIEGLAAFIDPSILPEEYGGTLPPMGEQKSWTQAVTEHESEFEYDTKFGFLHMTLKSNKKQSQDAIDTLPGQFRKLNVD